MQEKLPKIATTPLSIDLKTNDGEIFEIPAEGAIGLLALGDVGIILWRQKIKQLKTVTKNKF